MAITDSWGYEGEINAPEWAQMLPFAAGMQYGVRDFAAWRPTIGGSGDRAVTIAAGDGWGHGVLDRNDAPVVLNLPAASSGSRWDLIVARRVWATGATTFDRVAGSATKALPPRLNTPGVEDEQPIALARVQAGSAVVVELIDLRCIPGDSGLLALNTLALSYLTRPGTKVRIGDIECTRVIDALGTASWAVVDVTPDTGWVNVNGNSGWTEGHVHYRRIGGLVYVRIFRRRWAGWNVDAVVADNVPARFRPDLEHYAHSTHASNNDQQVGFTTAGRVFVATASNGAVAINVATSYPAARPSI